MTPEFARPHRLDQIGVGESRVTVTAEPGERAALAERFDLQAIDALEANYALRREGAGVHATGHLSAKVTQSCVATGDPVPAAVEEDFEILFLPEGGETGDEIELSADECDTAFFTGGAIDLGEAAAETLALALDPFPRSPRAAQALKDAGVISEEEAGPFGALAGLRDMLGKQ
ncbi:YceD family protein [Sphingomonas sp.]|uniref:YceD family protein n=1 Tax=Sphingomonas sp. TaxID=28214 RepID=UPI001B08D492|nr:YceD family protein [Sphingomonas sp.]MBO9712378.1 DUF177 domain-containing protein [Sphingomonas sp.]